MTEQVWTVDLDEQERNVVLDALQLATGCWEPLEPERSVDVAERLHERLTAAAPTSGK